MADLLPYPTISDLQDGDWIDLDKLGSQPLLTYIKYDTIALNDRLWPNWRGCSAQGEVRDFANARVDVTVEGGYTPSLGMPVHVPNDVLTFLNQGWAFYSYAVGLPGDPNTRGPESRRIFCYVGKRPVPATLLPVVQIKESHGLALDPKAIGSAGATAVMAPYRAMSVGDSVTFTWQGYSSAGVPEDEPHTEMITLKVVHLAQPLEFSVPRSQVIVIPGGYAEISYCIEYAGGLGQKSVSEQQTIRIVAPDPDSLLPEITIKDYDGGPIDPQRDGLTLQIKPLYAGIQDGDGVLMHWTGVRSASVIKSLRVDRSTLDSGVLEFYLEPKWLLANSGAKVTVSYQYARAGAGESGKPLQLEVSRPLNLPPPLVEGATGEGEGNGYLRAETTGAYVNVPESATVGPNDMLKMHWEGHPNGGRHVASPIGGTGKRFFIPGTAIAANMSEGEDKRFPVFYSVTPQGGVAKPSRHFNLRILPQPSTVYPDVQCKEAQGTRTVSLRRVDALGANLYIGEGRFPAWPFMAEGQPLTIEATGVPVTGSGRVTVRNAVPVTAAEFTNKKIDAKLIRAFLLSLKRNEQFTLKAKVSFDGGETYTPFDDASFTLTD
ncbi:hypothetical protein [Pseudomonas fluorescens]|uniref:Uncharacterized protein n=1 Tax=Pseudomonas fluorescens TaxID=294 RepID=A0A5E7FUC4_PSEFL|nr:hypothetical protein [Pseudomonas fluorescens]VVO42916.1 hypothetical protein PS723_06086 [Pseudomonas fluorescens]